MTTNIELNGLTVLTGRRPREQKALCDELSRMENTMRMSKFRPGIFSNAKPTLDALAPAMASIESALREMGTKEMDYFFCMCESERIFAKIKYVLGNWHLYSKVHDTMIFESPESYLHPHYQNMLAEALILAVKGGVKVFVETNSSNFTLALDALMRKYEVSEYARFYHAERVGENSVAYRDVTSQLEAIYDDFVEPLAKMDVLRDKYNDLADALDD